MKKLLTIAVFSLSSFTALSDGLPDMAPTQILENAVTGNVHYYYTVHESTELDSYWSLIPVKAVFGGLDTTTTRLQVEFIVDSDGKIIERKNKELSVKNDRGLRRGW